MDRRIAYFDCPTGISGDMCLGALVSAGVPLDYLRQQLEKLGIADEYKLWSELVQRNDQQATKVHVYLRADANPDQHAPHRHLPEIEHLIRQAKLPPRAEAWSLKVFQTLAIAEGAVHGIPPEQVHFHEVGATDALVDVVGTCLGLDWLDPDAIYCSALPTGGGTVRAAHGRLPVPTPAVLKLWELRGVPIYANGIDRELVTPTGAALVTALAQSFGPCPPMRLRKIGLGAGSQQLALPNILRLWLGEPGHSDHQHSHRQHGQAHHSHAHDHVDLEPDLPTPLVQPERGPGAEGLEPIAVLETQVDDLSPQVVGYLFDELPKAGALDVFTQAVGMKKSRPGLLLTVLCKPEDLEQCETVLFRETSTLGIRRRIQSRSILNRQFQTLETIYGPIQVKIAQRGQTIVNVQPEYEDCARLARAQQVPLAQVQQAALASWRLVNQR
ncbi:nickel pincer cofactor biosynthesis protein LarC [Leptolyngbya sp. FACHB-261]|uniref:nickel pincer cofactor biosynthesis protein LarC n=1 Tax=Leptolyngbya sp. FACHB-261 TaxID=2692806 RepID=UPI00168931CA|nr:nickel pincer cofactor biosynthesis protein LarC [Leptolyngbya sp. FACHB-261]MBD2103333.1 nickel pincer cofactor biosynthesis protein LarC [Leptolyngbya sp. FACHB-261]